MAYNQHLHARKKVVEGDEEEASHKISLKDLDGLKKKSRRFRGPSELQYAVSAVASFLVIGLCLGYFLMQNQHRKVVYHVIRDPWSHGKAAFNGRAGFHHHFFSGQPRFVSVVMPSVVNPAGRPRRLNAIQDTWGPYARAIFVVHNISEFPQASHLVISEDSTPDDPYMFPQLLKVPASIGFEQGLPRLYYTIRAIYEKVDPDFAFFVNDHTFVIPEHLCKFLENRNEEQDLYAGHALKNGKTDVFNSGAAGYVLSRATMANMIERWDQHNPECWVEEAEGNSWLQGNPGLVTSRCLESLGIRAIDTRAQGKYHRFHAFPLTRVVSGAVDGWYKEKHAEMSLLQGFDGSYRTLLSGADCCAADTVSFHYVEYMESKSLFAAREALLENPHVADNDLKAFLLKQWPSRPEEIGGYSRGLPKEGDDAGWEALLAVMRKISARETQRDC